MKATGIRQWRHVVGVVIAMATLSAVCASEASAAVASAAAVGPTATISSPAAGGVYALNATVPTSFSCTDSLGGTTTLQACSDNNGTSANATDGWAAKGTLNTSKVGQNLAYTVTAQDATGSNSTSITYTVADPPTATITSPSAPATYAVGQSVTTSFSCADGTYGPGIQSCTDSNGSTTGTGALDTSKTGTFTYTVTPVSQDGQTGQPATYSYTVAGPPTAKISSPSSGGTYVRGAAVPTSFSCSDSSDGSGIQSCTDSNGSTSGTGALDTSQLGTQTYSVVAHSKDGQSGSASITYTVVAPSQPPPSSQSSGTPPAPSTTITPPSSSSPTFVFVAPPSIDALRPIQGAVYHLDEKVIVVFSCTDVAGGPGLQSCTGTAGNGRRLDTSKLGKHTFTVTGADRAGESTSETITYTVVPTTNRFAIRRVRRVRGGITRLALALPGPGTVSVLVKAWNAASGGGRLVFARRRITVRRPGALNAAVVPTSAGRRLLRMADGSARGQMSITYRPTGGHPRTRRVGSLRL